MLSEVRMARIMEAVGRQVRGEISCVEAADLLGMSERHFRRLRDRYEAEGAEGLIDRRRGRQTSRRVAVDRIEWAIEEYRTRYWDFTAKHFHERIKAEGFPYGYTVVKRELQKAGLVAKARRRGAHRKRRPRKPLEGMMLLQDGSTHRWIPAIERDLDLIATQDDAKGALLSLFLVDQEGTMSTFRALGEVIAAKGLPSALYTDRGSHYFFTPKAGGKVAKDQPTQVGRALVQLGIRHIPSYTPQGRGRIERLMETLQGRVPMELRAAGITTVEEANRYLREVFLPDFNRRFAVEPAEPGSAFVPWVGLPLAETLCIQEERTVGNDNCVRYEGRILQIPPQLHRNHFVKATVTVKHYVDLSLAIFHGPRCLARYRPDGTLISEENTIKSAA
jgi:transposase